MTDDRKPPAKPGMKEVTAKFVDEAEAATAAPPSSASVTDDPLVALGRQWKEIYGKWVEADVYPDTSDRGAIRKYEKERTVLLLAISQLEDQAAEVAAQTVDGVLVQLRMAGTHYHLMERDGEQWANTYAKLTWQAWDGLERLVGGETQPDTALSALWQEHERLTAQYSEAIRQTDLAFTAKQAVTETETPEYGAAGTAHETAAQRQQEVSDDIMATENRMAKMPARTVMGALLKLRVAGAEIAGEFKGRDGVLDETLMGSVERLTLSALADLERLTGQEFVAVPTIEDPVLVLKREWETRWERYASETDDSDEVTDPLHDRVNETAYEIFQTPATTPAGIAFKLVLWARQHITRGTQESADWSRPPVTAYSRDLDHLPVVSALHDLERMSGVGIAVAPASVTKPTDPVVLLGQCWKEIKGKREQLKNRDGNDPEHPDVIEDERLHDIQLDIEKSIADTPTRTAAGVAVKLRYLQRDDEDFDGMSDWHPATFRTVLEALARIEG